MLSGYSGHRCVVHDSSFSDQNSTITLLLLTHLEQPIPNKTLNVHPVSLLWSQTWCLQEGDRTFPEGVIVILTNVRLLRPRLLGPAQCGEQAGWTRPDAISGWSRALSGLCTCPRRCLTAMRSGAKPDLTSLRQGEHLTDHPADAAGALCRLRQWRALSLSLLLIQPSSRPQHLTEVPPLWGLRDRPEPEWSLADALFTSTHDGTELLA